MKKFILMFLIGLSFNSFASTVVDSTCEIAIPKAYDGYNHWVLNDDVLYILTLKGYYPYRGNTTSGLYLDWGFSCIDGSYGHECITKGALKRVSTDGRLIILHAGKSVARSMKMSEVLEGFPYCSTY